MPIIKYENRKGERLQGITTIRGQQLGWGKQPLMIWANKQGLNGKTLNEARDIATVPGTIAHLMIELYLAGFIKGLKNQSILINPQIAREKLENYSNEDIDKAFIAFKNFYEWTKQFKFKPIEVEPHLIGEKYQLGGTPDVIGKVLGKPSIIDWKTGKIHEDVFLQLAFYKIVWEENHPEMPITGGFHVLRIPKDEDIPSFHHSHWAKLPKEATEAIEACLTLKKCQEVLKKLL